MNFRYQNRPLGSRPETHAGGEALRAAAANPLVAGLTVIAVQLFCLFGGEREWANPSPMIPAPSPSGDINPAAYHSVPPLQTCGSADIVSAATPFRQKGQKYMSKRSGQRGQVLLRNNRWVGRFYIDVPGDSKRTRRALMLGTKRELTRSEAKRKLLEVITQEGVNTPTHLERSLKPPTTFADVADAWELKRLPQL